MSSQGPEFGVQSSEGRFGQRTSCCSWTTSELFGAFGFGEAGDGADGVFPVELFEDIIGEVEGVDAPSAFAPSADVVGGFEILIPSFQEAEVATVDVGAGGHVDAEQYAVLVVDDEIAGGVGLAAEFIETRGDIDNGVGAGVQESSN